MIYRDQEHWLKISAMQSRKDSERKKKGTQFDIVSK